MENLNRDTKDIINLSKYKLILIDMDLSKYSEEEEDKIGFELSEIIQNSLIESKKYNVPAPYFYTYYIGRILYCYIVCDDFLGNTIVNTLDILKLEYNKIDLTDDFLNLNINIENLGGDVDEYNDFIKKIETFKFAHINIDKVLDKIGRSGIESLTESEKNYLTIDK